MSHIGESGWDNRKRDSDPDRIIGTREAAAMCCVSQATVVRWIRDGKLAARKGPDRQYRIHRADLNRFMLAGGAGQIESEERGLFQYCWEYYSKSGEIGSACEKCVVYRTRNGRCYEAAGIAGETGHLHRFCKSTCEECDYFKKVKGKRPGVLAVTCDDKLNMSLRTAVDRAGLDFKTTDCEYRCLMMLDRFLPDFVIIDRSLGDERSRDFMEMLNADPRIPYVKIVLIGDAGRFPSGCDKITFAFLERRFTPRQIKRLLNVAPEIA
jgi:excisionase family DNA binding protein